MNIKHSDPIAGQPLEIDVKVGNRWASLVVLLDEEKLMHKRFDCPDPPCHERIVLQLEANAKGKVLRIEGKDPDGPQTVETVVQ